MLAFERQQEIQRLLEERGTLKTTEFCQLLHASPATIRNDLNHLGQQGLLRKIHGGAMRLTPLRPEHRDILPPPHAATLLESFEQRKIQHTEQKEAIAEAALAYVHNGQCILFDASSTAIKLAQRLAVFERLLVVTNGIFTMLTLRETPVDTVMIGGFVSKHSGFINGTVGADILGHFKIDTAFVSARGFSLRDGLTDFDLYEVELKRQMCARCNHIVAMVDSSKLDQASAASFLPAKNIGVLLTDDGIEDETVERYREKGIDVRVCPVGEQVK